MRTLTAMVLLVTSLMAGCVSDEPPATSEPPQTPPSGGIIAQPPQTSEPIVERKLMTQFRFDECDGVRFTYLLPVADAQNLVPGNYTPSVREESRSVPAPEAQQASVQADLFQCQGFTAGRYFFEDIWFGIVYVPVDAPADGREADSHAYIVQMVAGEDVMAAIWKVVLYPTHNGTAGIQDFDAQGAGLQTGKQAFAGDYRWDVASAIPDLGAEEGTFAWYHELDDGGRLTWTGTQGIPAGVGGGSSLSYPPSSPLIAAQGIQGQPLSGEGSVHMGAAFHGMDLVKELAEYRE